MFQLEQHIIVYVFLCIVTCARNLRASALETYPSGQVFIQLCAQDSEDASHKIWLISGFLSLIYMRFSSCIAADGRTDGRTDRLNHLLSFVAEATQLKAAMFVLAPYISDRLPRRGYSVKNIKIKSTFSKILYEYVLSLL